MIISTRSSKKSHEPKLSVFYYSEVTDGLRVRTAKNGRDFAASVPALSGAYGDVYAGGLAGARLPLSTAKARAGLISSVIAARGSISSQARTGASGANRYA